MEEISTVDYLTQIPDELKLKICSYLNTFDMIQLAKLPGFSNISSDRKLIRKVSVYSEYRLEIEHWKGFVTNKLRKELIVSVNINCVYWIPGSELRKSLKKLMNLEQLYAVGTSLSLSSKDCQLYSSLQQLKTVATTFRRQDSPEAFPLTVVNLYLHIEHYNECLLNLVSKLKHLEEIWISDVFSCTNLKGCAHKLSTIVPIVKKVGLTFNIEGLNRDLYKELTVDPLPIFTTCNAGTQFYFGKRFWYLNKST